MQMPSRNALTSHFVALSQPSAPSGVHGRANLARLRGLVKEKLGSASAQSQILPVPELPQTFSGKYMRSLLRRVASGEPLSAQVSSLACS